MDIPAFTGKYGVFEHLHFIPTGDEFSRLLCSNAEKFHGTAGRHFIEKFIENRCRNLERVRELMDQFKKENTPPNADGQVLRVLNRFAFIAAAGTLDTELGITGWPKDEAFWGAKVCFEAWLKNRGGISAQEGQEILRQVRHFFEKHGDSRFTMIGQEDQRTTVNRAGYKKMLGDRLYYFVFTESFKQDLCEGFDPSIAADVLIEKGWLIPDSQGKSTRAENLPCNDSTMRCYRFDACKIFAGEL